MAFIVFNGTVVYETGFIRWAGLALFFALGLFLLKRLRPGKKVQRQINFILPPHAT